MIKLQLYANATPNIGDNAHILFNTDDEYIKYLGTPALTLDNKNYRFIAADVLRVEMPDNYKAKQITYIVAKEERRPAVYYHVTHADNMSGYTLYYIQRDEWANNIAGARISDIFVHRCNRNIGAGIYDPIQAPTNFYRRALDKKYTVDDLGVLFTVLHEIHQNTILTTGSSSAVGTYFFEIMGKSGETMTARQKLDYTLSLCAGIYGYKSGALETSRDAATLRAYIVPKSWVNYNPNETDRDRFDTASKFTKWGAIVISPYTVTPTAKPQNVVDFFIEPNAEETRIIGTAFDGVQLARRTKVQQCTISCITKHDGVQIFVTANGENKDISTAFEVGLVTNDGNTTTLKKATAALNSISSFTAAGASFASGNVLAGAMLTGQALLSIPQDSKSNYTPAGDGLTTWALDNFDEATPFYIQFYTSADSETKKAGLMGATFNTAFYSLENLANMPKLDASGTDDIYIQCTARVSGVPTEGIDAIKNALETGVYIKAATV